MARPTAPSMWLPGFDPIAPALPSLAENVSHSIPRELDGCVEAQLVNGFRDLEDQEQPATIRANWRVVATATEAAPRILWPQLTRADLEHLTGPAAKFEEIGRAHV